MKRIAPLLAICAVALVSACGFQPVYGPALSAEGGQITIDEIEGRAGHQLRRELLQQTRIGLAEGNQQAHIVVDLDERIIRLGFRPDGASFRGAVRLQADYVVDFGDDAVSGRAVSEAYYTLPPNQPYADVAAQNEAAERAARDLATKIVDNITLTLAATE